MSLQKSANFVDAGYLYAAGSSLLFGKKQRRVDLNLNIDLVLHALGGINSSAAVGAAALRTYWYDGLLSGQETPEQRRIAETSNLKARFGVVNSFGEQKGVDSLIVIDLIDLARDRVISDAFILAGDEDLRVGVEVAQRYGVRVHLIGITPCRGNQSQLLRREADTTHEWDDSVVRSFLSIRTVPTVAQSITVVAQPGTTVAATIVSESLPPDGEVANGILTSASLDDVEVENTTSADEGLISGGPIIEATPADKIHAAVSASVKNLADHDIQDTLDQWSRGAGLPYDVDRQLLRTYGAIAPGDIDMTAKRDLRRALIVYLRALDKA